MKANAAKRPCQCLLLTCLSAAAGLWAAASGRCGSVSFDGSLGSAGALNGPNFLIPADRGQQVGGNLFHSFSKLDLSSGESASFQGPASIGNILARITDGAASSIDGTLRSEISGANLFLINPAGVIFGPNARLDISGSFAVTTADFLRLADGGKFNARLGGDDLLTAAPVSAFGFLSPAPAPISLSGGQFVVPEGRDLTVVAGDLTLDGALVAAPSGRLSLVSARAAGNVPASPDALAASGADVLPGMGAIELKNGAFANIDGNGGGRVVIRGGRLQVIGSSRVSSENRGGATGGPVDVRVTDSLVLREGLISGNARGAGRGGDVAVEAPALSIGGTAFVSGIFAASGSATGSRGGDVDVRSDDLALTAGGTISTTTFGIGDGGDVRVAAGRLRIDGESSSIPTGIFAQIAFGAIGRGGGIFVESADAAIVGGGVISGDTFGQGNGGNVSVSAARLRIDPASSGVFTGISSSVSPDAIGDGGDVIVRSDDLGLVSGAAISANTFGRGNGGTVQVFATKLTLATAGIFANVGFSAMGRGGDVIVQSDDLALTAGGTISASTFGRGDAGDTTITARKLRIDREGFSLSTGIFGNVEAGANGRGGDIVVRSEDLAISGGGVISAGTFAQGDGGSINVAATKLRIDGEGAVTGIFASVGGGAVGRGGGVIVQSDDLAIFRGGQISSNTFGLGDGGSVRVSADRLRIEERGADSDTGIFAAVSEGARGDGGDLHVGAGDLSIIGGGSISADNAGRGQGGTVNVSAQRLYLDGMGLDAITAISSDLNPGAVGRGGDLIIHGDEITLLGGATISTDSFGRGDGGRIEVAARRLLIAENGAENFTGISSDLSEGAIGHGGNIEVKADEFTILGGGVISTDTFGLGDGGRIEVSARQLLIDGRASDNFTGISSEVGEEGIGQGGDIQFQVEEFTLLGGARISTDTSGRGDGGRIEIAALRLLIDRRGADFLTAISSDVNSGAVGRGGDLVIRGDEITLFGGASISTDTFGLGDGGRIEVAARRLLIAGQGFEGFTFISSEVGFGGVGRGGDIQLRADEIFLRHHGVVSAVTFGLGGAGSVRVTANTLLIDGESSTLPSGISSSVFPGAIGDGGPVSIAAGKLTLRAGGTISADTLGLGDGGPITVSAGRFSIDGAGSSLFTGLSSGVGPGAMGRGGDVLVTGDDVALVREGRITAATFGRGDAGSVRLRVGDLRIDTSRARIGGGIFANAEAGSTGRGGRVNITAKTITLRGNPDSTSDGGIIAQSNTSAPAGSVIVKTGRLAMSDSALITSANIATGNAGSIEIAARDTVTLDDDSLLTVFSQSGDAGSISLAGRRIALHSGSRVIASAGANGGSIAIHARDFFYLDHSSLAATAGSTLAASGGSGAGGNIAVSSKIMVLDHGTISANAALGRGGNIFLRADFFFSSGSTLTATGTTAGIVEIVAPELDLAAGLVILPGALVDVSTQLREQCARRLGLDFSSFLVIGRGGISLAPDEPLAETGPARKRQPAR